MDDEQITVELNVHGIVLTGFESDIENYCAYDGGTVTSDLLETCPHCNDPACEMDCPEYKEYATDRDTSIVAQRLEERTEFQKHRAAAHTIESMVLAHWCAGVDVTDPAYKEGIETTYLAIANSL